MKYKKKNKQNLKSAEGRKSYRSKRKTIKQIQKKTTEKLKKCWFIEKVNKFDKPLAKHQEERKNPNKQNKK